MLAWASWLQTRQLLLFRQGKEAVTNNVSLWATCILLYVNAGSCSALISFIGDWVQQYSSQGIYQWRINLDNYCNHPEHTQHAHIIATGIKSVLARDFFQVTTVLPYFKHESWPFIHPSLWCAIQPCVFIPRQSQYSVECMANRISCAFWVKSENYMYYLDCQDSKKFCILWSAMLFCSVPSFDLPTRSTMKGRDQTLLWIFWNIFTTELKSSKCQKVPKNFTQEFSFFFTESCHEDELMRGLDLQRASVCMVHVNVGWRVQVRKHWVFVWTDKLIPLH